MAARSRLPLIAGLGAATFGGYYMYRAGGSPKVAEKQMERMFYISLNQNPAADTFKDDAARLSTSVKDHLPGREKEIKTEAKVLGEQFGQKVDDAVSLCDQKTIDRG